MRARSVTCIDENDIFYNHKNHNELQEKEAENYIYGEKIEEKIINSNDKFLTNKFRRPSLQESYEDFINVK